MREMRLIKAGLGCLAVAAVLALVCLPHDFAGRGREDFSSRIMSSQSHQPEISVRSFPGPDKRSVVLWVEGMEAIPASHHLQ